MTNLRSRSSDTGRLNVMMMILKSTSSSYIHQSVSGGSRDRDVLSFHANIHPSPTDAAEASRSALYCSMIASTSQLENIVRWTKKTTLRASSVQIVIAKTRFQLARTRLSIADVVVRLSVSHSTKIPQRMARHCTIITVHSRAGIKSQITAVARTVH